MKPICRSKTFQKGEDVDVLERFLRENSSCDFIEDKDEPWIMARPLKYKTIITITKVVEDETKNNES